MGRGIAEACLQADLSVILHDVDAGLADRVAADAGAASGQIRVAATDSQLVDADLVIEAVPENLALKTQLLTQLDATLNGNTILASNSSSLSMTQLASGLQQPSRFCGLHFCHPVQQRPLVEVIGAESTDPDTLEDAFRFAQALGMTPIVVPDSPGFLLNRLLVPFLNEALELLLDGADVRSLDQAAENFGMPQGPLALFDDFGVDVALAVGRSLYIAFPDRISPTEMLIAMYKSKRLGRKSGGGFYRTQQDAAAGKVDPEVLQLIRERRRTEHTLSDDYVQQRLFLPMLLEATRILEDELVDNGGIVDKALQDGLGMTAAYSGLFGWADQIGAAALLQWLQPLISMGGRFQPTDLLIQAANEKRPLSVCSAAA